MLAIVFIMVQSPLRLIKGKIEFVFQDDINRLPRDVRGIYALFDGDADTKLYNVVYVGMSTSSVRGRLKSHRRRKKDLWTHCSIYQVWDNVREEEIRELEGILRHIYRYDDRANSLNEMKSFKLLKKVDKIDLSPTKGSSGHAKARR
jgi:hypothetical protein